MKINTAAETTADRQGWRKNWSFFKEWHITRYKETRNTGSNRVNSCQEMNLNDELQSALNTSLFTTVHETCSFDNIKKHQ